MKTTTYYIIYISLLEENEHKEIVDLKILQFDWLGAFWPISQDHDFPEYGICTGTQ